MPEMTAAETESAPTRTTVLVIDDDDLILEFVQICLESDLPDVEVTTYDSKQLGRPGPDFDWAAYDLLLLDYNLGDGETGVAWLEAFAGLPNFPPTILLTAESSARVVGNAVRTGASAYLNKSTLRPEVLVETVKRLIDTLSATPETNPAPTAVGSTADNDEWEEKSHPKFHGKNALETNSGRSSYKFIRLIGRGAMSQVYLAERSEDQSTVILKILDRDTARDPENVLRFAREGELISRIDSPYVVKVFDHGSTNSYGYIAMEFFGRGDLAQRMKQGVSAEDAVLYLHNIACGLHEIHRVGIVHRDLKPGNVMFRGDGSMALLDFGLSKHVDTELSLTETGVILGTPYCMSPEQTEGAEADHRSDLYAAGVIFYEMLMGERPFNGPNLPALLLAIQSASVPTLPKELARYQPIVDKLLAKDPASRYQSASELISALHELVNAT